MGITMWHQVTGILGRALSTNGYSTRRQLDPEELKTFLRPLYESLLSEIGYVAAVPLNAEAVSDLHKVMQRKGDKTGLDYSDDPVSAKGFTLGLSLACVITVPFTPLPPGSRVMRAAI